MAINEAQKAAEQPMIDKVTDPIEWVSRMAEVLRHLRELEYEVGEIERIVQANKRKIKEQVP